MKTIFDMLEKDHRKVESLMEKLAKTGSRAKAARERLLAELKTELTLHMKFEEKSVYPKFEELENDDELIQHSMEEHEQVRTMLKALDNADMDHEEWQDQLEELRLAIQDHVQEEENEMFPAMREGIEERAADKLAQQYAKQKERLKESAQAGASRAAPRARSSGATGGSRAARGR